MSHYHTTRSIRVVIADDHVVFRVGLRSIIDAEHAMGVVGSASKFCELPHTLSTTPADILILDATGMGNEPVPTIIRGLRQQFPQLGIIIYSGASTLIAEVLRAGALGYVHKQDDDEAYILVAIRTVYAGHQYLSPSVQRIVESGDDELVPREIDVLACLNRGWNTLQIAKHLNITTKTVTNYLTSIRQKKRLTTRTEMVDWYRQVYGG